MTRVLLHVQHLLGIGHLRRAATLARALAAGGFDVLLVSGGAPTAGLALAGVRFAQLPPVRAADETLRDICRVDGEPLDEAFLAGRRALLLGLLERERPDVVITEQFPFGRTRLRFELLPLIEAAKALTPRPLLVSSVRDVVRRAAPHRVAETVALLHGGYDAVLVHADPAIVPFASSFAGWPAIRGLCHFTGFVAERDLDRAALSTVGAGEVVVSAGGGAVGGPLLAAALAARPLTPLAGDRWRLLCGPNLAPAAAAALRRDDGVVVEPAREDFTSLLHNARLSISQAGYNTVVETLCLADRAVLVPFASERETEQADRAALLAARGMVAVVEGTLTGESLAAAVRRALAGPSLRTFPPCKVDGGPASAALLHRLLAERRNA
ncbi:MAG: glycosyltransferase [Reyranellaceae bacterium]